MFDKIVSKIKNIKITPIMWLVIGIFFVLCSLIFFIFKDLVLLVFPQTSKFLLYFYIVLELLMSILAFFPAYLLSWFVHKKTKSLKWTMFSIAFFIPFVNLLYFSIENMLVAHSQVALATVLGFLWLFFILPTIFVVTLCIPKKIIEIKYKIVLTTFLTVVLGWIMVVGMILFMGIKNQFFRAEEFWYYNPVTINQLGEYKPAIKYLKKFNKENGKYPENIDEVKLEAKAYPIFEYKTYNNDKDFILSVKKVKETPEVFRYCSSKELPDCKPIGYFNHSCYKQIGKWVHFFYVID